MAATESPPKMITPELEGMLKLAGKSDSVELKLTVPDERGSASASDGSTQAAKTRRALEYFAGLQG